MEILVNHIGYEPDAAKYAVLQLQYPSEGERSRRKRRLSDIPAEEAEPTARLLEADIHRKSDPVRVLSPCSRGPVAGWRGRYFYLFDFSDLRRTGTYVLRVNMGGAAPSDSAETAEPGIESRPFRIEAELSARSCISDILFYLKSQRCSGRWDAADKRAPFFGSRGRTADVHGGWYDASGDYSKYLSHLSYADYFNPQQSPLVVWSLLELSRSLGDRPRCRGTLLRERALEEARYGADFLVRMQDPEGYFYLSVFDRWSKKDEERMICSFRGQEGIRGEDYRAAFRQGGGMAIAALARASRRFADGSSFDTRAGASGTPPAAECAEEVPLPPGDFSPKAYLKAAEQGYAHLREKNREYLDNGRENIIDCYCRLFAAAELFRATGSSRYLKECRDQADRLRELFSPERGCWLTEAGSQRPFFHASDAGMPIAALLRYREAEPDDRRRKETARLILSACLAELSVTEEDYNPFGLARQHVQPVGGTVRSSFFIPHVNETGYWWQGENARLASLAFAMQTAAPLAEAATTGEEGSTVLPNQPAFPDLADRMRRYAGRQLDWILGLNPFDTCMLQGRGYNNPVYEEQYPNAPGGICNGITAGYTDENDIAFLPKEAAASGDHRWRWSEQWLPHAAWFLSAVAAR